MVYRAGLALLCACLAGLVPAAWTSDVAADGRPPAVAGDTQQEPIRPIPLTVDLDARKVALGKKLFNDPLLSRDASISCATCHPLATGGTDHRRHSLGVHQAEGVVTAPTVFNSSLNFKQFWDGRADSLEAQVDGPLEGAAEMDAAWPDVLDRLRHAPGYPALFAQSFPEGISRASVSSAIAEFERSLITPNARFDRWLRGDASALTVVEKSGYDKFKGYGCVSCHQGVNVGGNMFQRMGVIGDYFKDRGNITQADYGRFNVTGDEFDKFTFKVPSLRNVEKTAPYFHDGSAQTLDQAVTVMARYQLGRELPPRDVAELVAFLKTLTGEYDGAPL